MLRRFLKIMHTDAAAHVSKFHFSFQIRHLSSISRMSNIRCFSKSTEASSSGPCFRLSEEQLEMQAVARKFAREEIIPVAAELDRTGAYPWEIMKKAHALGLLNGHIPADIGGMDMDVLTGCVIAEELAYGCAGVKTAMEASGLGVK